MKSIWVLAVLSMGIPAQATTYTINAGASAATIQGIVNTAGSGPGNTVIFSAGSYSLASTVKLPCSNGTIYTGPNVGVVTLTNRPVAVLTNTVPTSFALQTNSNGTSFTGGQGCTIQYLCFSGTQGGIYVTHPSSGIVIQYNYFTLNNPPVGGGQSRQAIYLDGYQNSGPDPTTGASYITIVWNVFYDNCRLINAEGGGNGNVDSGGYCAATMVMGYNNHLVWNNNTVNLIEQGLKLVEQSAAQQTSWNVDVENNNLQGNSRIMIESQQDTNGVGAYSHNAFYQPNNPNNGTFELSVPDWAVSVSPTHSADDDVYIGNVPITGETGGGAHYGIGLELGGPGSTATNSLFQGGNGPETCGAGVGCTGWWIMVGGASTNATITGNYFSGTDIWNGAVNDIRRAVSYEDGATASIPGLVISSNTVVQTSTTIPIAPPAISAASGSGGSTITLSDSDTKHRLTFFYTTDGSTPAIFPPGGAAGSTWVYTGAFTVPAGTTVKAIASWGQGANQGIVFPSFGYVPSSVTTLGGSIGSLATKTLVSGYLHANANTMVKGGTLQFTAYGVYSDKSVSPLPDSAGNKVTGWNTSNHAIAKVSTLGHVTAVGTGTVNVQAVIGSFKSTPWTVTVGGAAQPAASAATPAAPAAARVNQGVGPAVSEESATAAGVAASPAAPEAAASASTEPAPAAAPADSAPAAAPIGSSSIPMAGPAPAAPGKAQPDAFLGPLWRVVSPAGGSASISNSHLFIGVPGGSNHDALLSPNQAVRVLQAIGNANYDVAIKIDSPLFAGDANTSQGLMVLSDSQNFITFALETDGSKIGLSAHTVTNGVATTVLEDQDLSQYQNPMYLRLTRNGSTYVAFYSTDGISWTQAVTFTDTRSMTGIGPFAGNHNDTPANAVPVVMSVNWFDVQQ